MNAEFFRTLLDTTARTPAYFTHFGCPADSPVAIVRFADGAIPREATMNESVAHVIDEIISFQRGNYTLDKPKVVEWMASEDVNVVGKLKHAIVRGWNRIVPPLSRAEWGELLLKAVLLGLRDQSDHAYPAYVSAWDYRKWIQVAFRDRANDAEAVDCFSSAKATLGGLYLTGDENQRDCIVNGILEHLFEDPDIRAAFEDWKEDAQLGVAYRLAIEWAEDGPSVRESASDWE